MRLKERIETKIFQDIAILQDMLNKLPADNRQEFAPAMLFVAGEDTTVDAVQARALLEKALAIVLSLYPDEITEAQWRSAKRVLARLEDA